MWAQRLGAIALAAVLIVGAVLLRRAISGGSDSPATEPSSSVTTVGGEGVNAKAVRVFPIAYGQDADTATLRRIAEASNAALYSASNPATINDVFTAVVSNF